MPVPPSELGISPGDDFDPDRRAFIKSIGIILGVAGTAPALLACRTDSDAESKGKLVGRSATREANSGTVRTESTGQTRIELGKQSAGVDSIRNSEFPEEYFRVHHEYPKISEFKRRLWGGYTYTLPGAGNGIEGEVRGFLIAKEIDPEGAYDKNMATTKRIIADYGKKIPLEDQLQGRRYVLSTHWASFAIDAM
ncbi:hypothetical protein HYZ78_00300 [Candidatus Microgenomates bacterium]|nr:hypothetical protein [Candidatus Microgenomates bacterium]